MVSEHFYPDRDSLFAALVQQAGSILDAAIERAQTATLLVSGGNSPIPLYRALSELDLAWSKVNIALVDERWVDADHPGSNAALIRRNLLQHGAAKASFIGMKSTAPTPLLGQAECEHSYRALPRPFDLTILGMGPDGHTASLFPEAKGLEAALDIGGSDLCAAISAVPSEVTGDLTERMSLTLSGILQSRQIHLLITGTDKKAVYQDARDKPDAMQTPVSAILQQDKVPVSVYWAP